MKPENILIEQLTGRVCVSDFGVAKRVRRTAMTRTGAFVGTVDLPRGLAYRNRIALDSVPRAR